MVSISLRIRVATNTIKPHNEDIFGSVDNVCWLIDGSTSLSSRAGSDVLEFVSELSDSLKQVCSADPKQPLAAIVSDAHRRTLERRHSDATDTPTASLILARAAEAELQIYALGDCSGYVRRGTQITEVIDPQFRGRESRILESIAAAIAQGIPSAVAYQDVREHLKAERRRRNTDEGLWILGADPDAAHHGHTATFRASDQSGVDFALMSDGYRRARDTYGLYRTADDFLSAIAIDPDEPIRQIRQVESLDPSRTRFIRLSAQDDATVAYVVTDRSR